MQETVMIENKKRAVLNGSLNFTGTEALRTDMKLASLSAAYVNAYILNVDKPATPCMTVRMAYGISCYRASTAAITEL